MRLSCHFWWLSPPDRSADGFSDPKKLPRCLE
jgi:hypothetical protein